MSETLKNLQEAIGRYGVQCSETKELAPASDLVVALGAVAGELAALKADAERLRAMAKEWDEWQKHLFAPSNTVMPIWEALCNAIGDGADGNGLRAAIDAAMQPTTPEAI